MALAEWPMVAGGGGANADEIARDLRKGTGAFLAKYLVSDEHGALVLFGRRYALCRPDLLILIQRELEAVVGRASAGILYRAGVAFGRDAPMVVPELAPPAGHPAGAWDLDTLNRLWAHMGVGQIHLVSANAPEGRYEFSLERSMVADAYGRSDRPVCHLYAGWAAGILETLTGRESLVEETACAAAGDPRCVLVARPAD